MSVVRRLSVASALAATSALSLSTSPAAAVLPEVSGASGSVTIGELTGTSLVLTPGKESDRHSFEYLMPKDAVQGPDTWYLIRMNVAVNFAKGSDQGSTLVSASVNGTSSGQVEFFREDGSVSWTSANLIHGSYGGEADGRTARARHTNFLLTHVVKGGLNRLSFTASSLGGADVQSVTFGKASGVYATPVGWVDLEVDASFPDEVEIGETAVLEVTARNLSRRPAKGVTVEVQPGSPGLFTRGPITQRIDEIEGTATRRFRFGTSRPGPLGVVVVAAESRSGEEAVTRITAQAVGKEDSLGSGWRAAAILALLGSLLAAAAFSRRGPVSR